MKNKYITNKNKIRMLSQLPLHKKNFQIRVFIFLILIIFSFTSIIIRLSFVKMSLNEEYYVKALELWTRNAPVEGARGNIYDRNGKLIVGSVLTPTVICIPSQVTNKELVASDLARILDVDTSSILKHLNKHVSVEIIKPSARRITVEEASSISKLRHKGIYVVADTTRYYPYDTLLAHTIGIVGSDNQGLSGIEYKYDSYLKGEKGGINIYTDAHGTNIGDLTSFYVDAKSGNDIYLTVDLDIQISLERVLNNASIRYDPEEISALVMDPKTSEILAMASYPTFSPSNYQDYPESLYNRNLPIWSNYEPGSVFKIVTYSAGLEEKKFRMDEIFYDPGYKIVSGVRIKDWKAGGHGRETFLEVIQNSCNPGFMEIGERLGVSTLFKYIKAYGFGVKSGIDIVGESSGILFKEENVGPVELATSSFGQGNSVTMLQLVNATSAAVNGGILNKPNIVSKIMDEDNIILENKKTEIRRVISEETSKDMRYALECVASLGTARSSYIPNYRVGGKTGTAQVVVDGKYQSGSYILSFVGIAPMNNPELVVMIAMKNAKNTIQYGGVVVAPMVKEVLMDALTIKNIPPQTGGIAKSKLYWYDLSNVIVNNHIGTNVKDLPKYGKYNFKIIGNGEKVLEQIPEPGEEIIEGGYVLIYT